MNSEPTAKPHSAGEIDERNERQVYLEQISLLFTSTAKGLVATVVNVFATSFIIWNVLDITTTLIWGAANILVALVAALTIILFKGDPKQEEHIERWRMISLVRLLFSGLALGSLAFVFTAEHPMETQIFYYFVVGGMMAGASAVYSIKKEMFMVYACTAFLPMTARFFTYGQTINYAMAGMGVLFFGIMMSSARSMYSSVINALVLRFKNEALADRVLEEKRQTEMANHQLTLARDELWGEMQLAQKIQTVLLPKNPRLQGYEVTAHMKPADEIGGDYYDVITAGGYRWVIIGDVSGHGVSAGLVQMMAQTAIQTVLAASPTHPPSRLLEEVNNVIAKNISKLSKNKYMTITVFALQDEGRVLFAGLHQDILVYRSASQTVETIPTEGMWIGVSPNLKGMVHDESFRLDPGDTMLLFTDGITEAQMSDVVTPWGEREMFGQERLEAVLAENGERSCAEIKDIILKRVEGCKFDDDMTFLIVKRSKP